MKNMKDSGIMYVLYVLILSLLDTIETSVSNVESSTKSTCLHLCTPTCIHNFESHIFNLINDIQLNRNVFMMIRFIYFTLLHLPTNYVCISL